jgi:hypothetical protein
VTKILVFNGLLPVKTALISLKSTNGLVFTRLLRIKTASSSLKNEISSVVTG